MSFETIDAVVRELYPHANDLARAVGVAYPKSDDSPGALWLYRVRDYLSEDWERILSSDEPSGEIEWNALETNTYQQWLIFADLELWNYDAEAAFAEEGSFMTRNFHTETYRAVKVDDIPDIAEHLLEEIANRLWTLILQDVQNHINDITEEEE